MRKILFILGTLEFLLSILCGTILADPIQMDDLPCAQLPMCEQRDIGQTANDLSDELAVASFSFSESSYVSSQEEIIPFIYRVLKPLSPIFNDFVEVGGLCVASYYKLSTFVAARGIDISSTEKRESQQQVKAAGKGKVLVSTKAPSPEGVYAIQMGAFAKKENAERFQRVLHKRYANVNTFIFKDQITPFYRVRLGYFQTQAHARRHLEIVKKDTFSGVIVRKD